MPNKKLFIIIIFLAAFLLRFLLIPNPGFEADISFWKSWGLATKDLGIVDGMKVSNNNYPTPFSYALGSMVWIYSIFADPHNFNQFWTNTNLLFLTIMKLYPILADLGIAAMLLYLGGKSGLLFASLYLFNPVSLMGGAWWGQVDSLGVCIFLVALILALKHKPFWAGLVYMAAVMTKLQNMIYGPLFFLFIWQTMSFDGLVKALAGSTAAFFGMNIEFFLSHNMNRVIDSLTLNYDYFPLLSLNAFNLWWIVAGAHGMQMSDKMTVLGITNAKTIGLYLFSASYLFAVLRLLIPKKIDRVSLKNFRRATSELRVQENFPASEVAKFIESLIIVNASFFLFQTQSHDRYGFPLVVFLLLWAIEQKQKKFFSPFVIFYVLFSLLYFYNLNTAMLFNYPNNGLPFLPVTAAWTTAVSWLFLGLFGFFVYLTARRSHWLVWTVPIAAFLLLLVKTNIPLLTHSPVFLTKFTPIISRQDFGSLQIDMSVGSSSGIKSWNRLSVQYAFYRHGIGTHANSQQVFDINKKFKKFSADYGIDTEAGAQARAIFEIYGDNRLLFRSGVMGRYDLPRHTEVDVTGVKLFSLVTTAGGNGNIDDHTDWLNPILYP